MIYELKNSNFTLRADTLGAQLVSLENTEGFEYIWVGNPAYWREHAPVLFPIVGALREDKVKIGGVWHEMNRHGFAKRSEFTLCSRGDDFLSFRLEATDETRRSYPFDFALTVTYTLKENGYTTTFKVENTGSAVLPFSVGGHPGFNLPVNENAAFEDYTLCFEKSETQRCPVIQADSCLIDYEQTAYNLNGEEIPLRHSLFYNDALVFDNLNSNKVQIINKSTGAGIEMEFSQFPMLGVWSAKNDGPYVCLEPWTGCATLTTEGDDLEQKKNCILLSPGEMTQHGFTVNIL